MFKSANQLLTSRLEKGGPGSGRHPEGKSQFESPKEFVMRGLSEAAVYHIANAKEGKPPMMGYSPKEKLRLAEVYRKMPVSERNKYAGKFFQGKTPKLAGEK